MGIFKRSQTTQQVADEVGRSTGTGNAPARSVSLVKQSGPAVQRDTVQSTAPDLVKKFDKVGVSLSKRGLDGIRAEAVMLLDYSGSMSMDYSNGTVQALVERSLAFALQIDMDGTIPVIRFGSDAYKPVNVSVGNYQRVVNGELSSGRMGTTNLTAALDELLQLAKTATAPLFAIIVTDGNPDDRRSATNLVRELAKYPVFVKFLAIQPVNYLQELDDMGNRLLDNVDSQFVPDPRNISDLDFADKMVEEWDTWVAAAQTAGVLA